MKTITLSLGKPITAEECCACIGYFDGLHRGHRALLAEAVKAAKEKGVKSALITFYPDPLDVLTGEVHLHIQDFATRLSLIGKAGIELVYILDFTKEMASLPPEVFVREILEKLQLKTLVCGFDFHYGAKGAGDAKTLAAGNYEVRCIEEVSDEGKISSTRIRNCLAEGKIEEANRLLGYSFFLQGEVISGLRNGRRMGYPTANIAYHPEQLLPLPGVYSGYAEIHGQLYQAMINFGDNPTIVDGKKKSLEVHLLDFEEDIYGEVLRVYFLHYLRGEKRFASLEALKQQLAQDEVQIREGTDEVSAFH